MSDYNAQFAGLWSEDRYTMRDTFVALAKERDALKAEVERLRRVLREAKSWLANMHADEDGCLFNGVQEGDVGCMACSTFMAMAEAKENTDD